MSAEKKPGTPADIPPFLHQKGESAGGPNPKSQGAGKAEQSPDIPFFLRAGAKPTAPERPVPAPPKTSPPPAAPRSDPGLLRTHEVQRPPVPPSGRTPAPSLQDPSSAAPTFLRSPAPAPDEAEAHAALLLSSEEVQRKLEAAKAQSKQEEWAPPPANILPERPKPKAADVQGPIDWDSATGIFDAMVTGIRKDRQQLERDTIDQTTKMEADWQHVLVSMRELQRKVQGHRNLIYFTISRDSTEISIKVVDHSSKRGYSIYTLARKHPTGAHPSLNAIWLIEFPARERHYYDAKEAMAELVSRIAGSLA